MVAKGEIQNVDFHPNENGGTRILKGIMVAGREGEELSWKLEGMAEVKVSIQALLPPLFSFVPPCSVSSPRFPSQTAKAFFTLVRIWH